jgi:hypothetical protein
MDESRTVRGRIKHHANFPLCLDGDVSERPSGGIVSVVDAIAVDVVIETTSVCPDRARAQAALADALAGARAPRRAPAASDASWTVRIDVEEKAKTRTASARIVDDAGTVIAERTVSDDRTACTPLARALGAWASLVLDDELARARDAADAPPVPPNEAKTPPTVNLDRKDWRTTQDPDFAPTPTAKPWTLELGLMGYVRDGLAGSSGFAGGSVFAAIEVSPGWFVRPEFSYGASTVQVALQDAHRASLVHTGLHPDFCRRIPGNYIERRGLELDVCVGGDVSAIGGTGPDGASLQTLRFAVGPSATFRGEIGDNANLELRLAGGYNILRKSLLDEGELPMVYAQAAVGVSWRFR